MKKIIIPLDIIANIGISAIDELLISNGFERDCEVRTETDVLRNQRIYTQDGDSK